jgi:hypothetical protein
MRNTTRAARLGLAVAAVALLATVLRADRDNRDERLEGNDAAIRDHAAKLVSDGRQIFRFDTFGSEAFWGGALRLHQTIAGSANGGVGAGVSPLTVAALGLKIDADVLPPDLVNAVTRGAVRLDDPATTLALLKLDAVVGVKGFFDTSRKLASVGIQCSLCHSTVDKSSLTSAIPAGVIGSDSTGGPLAT